MDCAAVVAEGSAKESPLTFEHAGLGSRIGAALISRIPNHSLRDVGTVPLQAETTIDGRLLGHATLKSWSGDAGCARTCKISEEVTSESNTLNAPIAKRGCPRLQGCGDIASVVIKILERRLLLSFPSRTNRIQTNLLWDKSARATVTLRKH